MKRLGFFIAFLIPLMAVQKSAFYVIVNTPNAYKYSICLLSKTSSINQNFRQKNQIKSEADAIVSCNSLLVSLIKKSSFNPKVKKFKFKVWIDDSADGVETLKITIRNNERHEDMVISWLKLDTAKKKLLDITLDPDNPIELKYDSISYNKVINGCKL